MFSMAFYRMERHVSQVSRRMMLRVAAVPVAHAVFPWTLCLADTPDPVHPANTQSQCYGFFSQDDGAFIEAAVERMIPADENGPGARHTGVAIFIDRCLQGAWNSGDRLYRNHAWQAGWRVDDYRLPETPGALFRSALRGIEDDLAQRPGLHPRKPLTNDAGQQSARSRFPGLPASLQDAYLRSLQTDVRPLDGVPSWLFLDILFALTVEAFFADPAFSGSEDTVAAWSSTILGASGNRSDCIDRSWSKTRTT